MRYRSYVGLLQSILRKSFVPFSVIAWYIGLLEKLYITNRWCECVRERVSRLFLEKNSALTLRSKHIKLPFLIGSPVFYIPILRIRTNIVVDGRTTQARGVYTKGMHVKIIMVNMDLFNRTFFVCDDFFVFYLFFSSVFFGFFFHSIFAATVAVAMRQCVSFLSKRIRSHNKSNRSLIPSALGTGRRRRWQYIRTGWGTTIIVCVCVCECILPNTIF